MEIERPIAPLPLRSLSITRNTFSVESVIVAMNEPWNFTKRCRFPQLLDDPFQRGASCYVPMPNPPTSMFNNHKHLEGLTLKTKSRVSQRIGGLQKVLQRGYRANNNGRSCYQ
jgi:hypothetical protein